MAHYPIVSAMSRETLAGRYLDAISLLDGCYEIIELFKPESPSQVIWKQKWLAGARKHGAEGM